jgi:flavodoxin
MKKAIIFYQSKTGTTKSYAQEIEKHLTSMDINSSCVPVEKYHENLMENIDFIILGCWTKGLMVIFQKPDEIWNSFARKLSLTNNSKVALFTTFKITTGSMFKNMERQLKNLNNSFVPRLKSRKGTLSVEDITVLNKFILS